MSAIEIRADINKYLDTVDEGFLKVVHAMLDTYVKQQEKQDEAIILGYDINGKPKYADKMKAIYDKEVKDAIENGTYTTLENLEQEMEKW